MARRSKSRRGRCADCCSERCARRYGEHVLMSDFTISLTQDQQAIVNEQDWYRLRKHKWYAEWCNFTQSFYAARTTQRKNKKRYISMARQILGLGTIRQDPRFVDHISHDTLDNRRSNLRTCTRRGNAENLRRQSKYGVGVCLKTDAPRKKPYAVQIRIEKERKTIGHFSTPEEAQAARAKYIEEHSL